MTAEGDVLALGLSRPEEDKFHLWEKGLPSPEELVPLNQSLISPVLARAFSIKELAPSHKAATEPDTEHPAQAAVRSLLQNASAQHGHSSAHELQLLPSGPSRGNTTAVELDIRAAATRDTRPTKKAAVVDRRDGVLDLFGKQQSKTKEGEERDEEVQLEKQQRRQWEENQHGGAQLPKLREPWSEGDDAALEPRLSLGSGDEEGETDEEGRRTPKLGQMNGRNPERSSRGGREIGDLGSKKSREREGERVRQAEEAERNDKALQRGGEELDGGTCNGVDRSGSARKLKDKGAEGEFAQKKQSDDESDSVERAEKHGRDGAEEAGGEGDGETGDGGKSGSQEKKRAKKVRNAEEDYHEDSAGMGENNSSDELNPRTLKRPRLVWTPQLHKRFVDAVSHLGIKNAVPKTIMQLMNVEGLTRENVASHLQKYRLYLKRMQGLSTDGPSASDQLFASTPMPGALTSPQQRIPALGAGSLVGGAPSVPLPGPANPRDQAAVSQTASLGGASFMNPGLPGAADPTAGSAGVAAAAAALGGQRSLLLNDQLAHSLVAGSDPLGRTLNAYAAAAAAAAGAYDMRQQLPFLPGNMHPLLMAGGGLAAWGGLAGGAGVGGASGLGAASALAAGDMAAAAGFPGGAGALAAAGGLAAARLPGASMAMGSAALSSLANLPGGGGFGLSSAFPGAGVHSSDAAAALGASHPALTFGGQLAGLGAHSINHGSADVREGGRERPHHGGAPESPRPQSPPKRALNLFPEA